MKVEAAKKKQEELHKKREDVFKQAAADTIADRDRLRREREAERERLSMGSAGYFDKDGVLILFDHVLTSTAV